ncbi:MAG: hypothetical protein AAF901_00920 [Bacteroidota bacterium]
MKQLKVLVLVVAVAFSSVLSASTKPEKAKKAESTNVTQTVGELLKNPSFELKHDAKAMVILTINKDNEFVVLSVDSEDETVENFIKSRLNYKKVAEDVSTGRTKTFKIPVRITAS